MWPAHKSVQDQHLALVLQLHVGYVKRSIRHHRWKGHRKCLFFEYSMPSNIRMSNTIRNPVSSNIRLSNNIRKPSFSNIRFFRIIFECFIRVFLFEWKNSNNYSKEIIRMKWKRIKYAKKLKSLKPSETIRYRLLCSTAYQNKGNRTSDRVLAGYSLCTRFRLYFVWQSFRLLSCAFFLCVQES